MKESIQSFRGEMKKSRFKIWLRAGLFVIFGSLFTFYFFRDIGDGYFTWGWAALLFVLFIPVGFLLSRIVPMQADLEARAVTLSLDKFYLVLIWVLVIAKLIASRVPWLVTISDVIMCAILGIMFGRLGGIGLRVRQLKTQHGFVKKQP
jgi:predicted Na+-dependent transporter